MLRVTDAAHEEGNTMADLIAIGYPDLTTADEAADVARRLGADLITQPDEIAVIVRDKDGSYHVHTTHHMVGGGAIWACSGGSCSGCCSSSRSSGWGWEPGWAR
jgi:uncharacterized membrane protein